MKEEATIVPAVQRSLGRRAIRFGLGYWALLSLLELLNVVAFGQWDVDSGSRWQSILNGVAINAPVLAVLACLPFAAMLRWSPTARGDTAGRPGEVRLDRSAAVIPIVVVELLNSYSTLFARDGMAAISATILGLVVVTGPGAVIVCGRAIQRAMAVAPNGS